MGAPRGQVVTNADRRQELMTFLLLLADAAYLQTKHRAGISGPRSLEIKQDNARYACDDNDQG